MNQGKYWMLTCNELSDAYVKVTNEGFGENAKMLVACLRVVSLRCQFFSDIFTKQPHPPARVNLWGGGWLPARVGLC